MRKLMSLFCKHKFKVVGYNSQVIASSTGEQRETVNFLECEKCGKKKTMETTLMRLN